MDGLRFLTRIRGEVIVPDVLIISAKCQICFQVGSLSAFSQRNEALLVALDQHELLS